MRFVPMSTTVFIFLFAVAGVTAQLGAEYVESSPGLIGMSTIDTLPPTYVYAISYALVPSTYDTTYVFVQDGTMVAAVQPGETWMTSDLDGNSVSNGLVSTAMIYGIDLATVTASDASSSVPAAALENAATNV